MSKTLNFNCFSPPRGTEGEMGTLWEGRDGSCDWSSRVVMLMLHRLCTPQGAEMFKELIKTQWPGNVGSALRRPSGVKSTIQKLVHQGVPLLENIQKKTSFSCLPTHTSYLLHVVISWEGGRPTSLGQANPQGPDYCVSTKG